MRLVREQFCEGGLAVERREHGARSSSNYQVHLWRSAGNDARMGVVPMEDVRPSSCVVRR